MPAPKGHPRWGNPLKPKKYTPRTLWIGACEYFDWCDKHPIKVIEQPRIPQKLTNQMAVTLKPSQVRSFLKQFVELPHVRAYSIEGLCNHLNITEQTFSNYSRGEGYETYFGVCSRIRQIIDQQHFENGMAGTMNANIVTRKLGLAEKRAIDVNSTQPKIEVVDQETKDAINNLGKGKK